MGWQTPLTWAQNRAAEEHCSSVEQGHPGEPAAVSQHVHSLSEQNFAQESYTLLYSQLNHTGQKTSQGSAPALKTIPHSLLQLLLRFLERQIRTLTPPHSPVPPPAQLGTSYNE